MNFRLFVVLFLFSFLLSANSIAQENQDQFLTGYISAVLEHVLFEPSVEVQVENGVATLYHLPTEPMRRAKIIQTLAQVEGVKEIQSAKEEKPLSEIERFMEEELDPSFDDIFPDGDLFEPLLAAPWESRFSASIRSMDQSGSNIAAVSLGEVFGLYRWNNVFASGHQIQLNVEAAAFGYFDLDSGSTDLQNIDFQAGFPLIYRYNDFSTRLRMMHRSSHLGDDYLDNNRNVLNNNQLNDHQIDNNFLDWIASYEWEWIRLYGGGEYIFDADPGRAPWNLTYGLELTPWNHRSVYPIAAVHLRLQEEFNWSVDQRYVFGVAFQDWPFRNRTTRLLGEYYNGKNLQWPFFREDGEYIGGGVYFEF